MILQIIIAIVTKDLSNNGLTEVYNISLRKIFMDKLQSVSKIFNSNNLLKYLELFNMLIKLAI